MNTNTEPILAWNAPARVTHERSDRWYLVGGLLCLTAVMYGVISGSWSLSVTFGMIGGLYYLTRNEKHPDHTISIREMGVEYDGSFRSWGDYKEFWILRGDGYHELHISTSKFLRPDIVIQTGEIDPHAIRDTIAQFLPMTDQKKERLLDAFIRFCKL